MKKTRILVATLVMALSVGTVQAFAQTNETQQTNAQNSGYFVDANEDGVCDNVGTGTGTGRNSGYFVDANEDGICDNVGTGAGRGRGQGGRGRGFKN